MYRFLLLFVASVGLAGTLSVGKAEGQYVPGAQSPAISPYLNLFRRGSSVANNYYNLVRPQIDTINNETRLQQGVLVNRSAIIEQAQAASGALPPTGRGAPGFFTHRGYFLNRGGGGRSGSAPPPTVGGAFPSAGGGAFPSAGGLDLGVGVNLYEAPRDFVERR